MRKKIEQILIELDYLVDVVLYGKKPYAETFDKEETEVGREIFEMLGKDFYPLPESKYKAFMQLKTLDVLFRKSWILTKRINDAKPKDSFEGDFGGIMNLCNILSGYLEEERNSIYTLLSEEEREEYQHRQSAKLAKIDETNENQVELAKIVRYDLAKDILSHEENGVCSYGALQKWFKDNKAEFRNTNISALHRVLEKLGLVKVGRKAFSKWFN